MWTKSCTNWYHTCPTIRNIVFVSSGAWCLQYSSQTRFKLHINILIIYYLYTIIYIYIYHLIVSYGIMWSHLHPKSTQVSLHWYFHLKIICIFSLFSNVIFTKVMSCLEQNTEWICCTETWILRLTWQSLEPFLNWAGAQQSLFMPSCLLLINPYLPLINGSCEWEVTPLLQLKKRTAWWHFPAQRRFDNPWRDGP